MSRPLTKPQLYRLTLRTNAIVPFSILMANQNPPRLVMARQRPDGKYDVGISHALFDQLQTASLPSENLSDTIVRVVPAPKGSI